MSGIFRDSFQNVVRPSGPVGLLCSVRVGAAAPVWEGCSAELGRQPRQTPVSCWAVCRQPRWASQPGSRRARVRHAVHAGRLMLGRAQVDLLDDLFRRAGEADEPEDRNFVRRARMLGTACMMHGAPARWGERSRAEMHLMHTERAVCAPLRTAPVSCSHANARSRSARPASTRSLAQPAACPVSTSAPVR